MADSSRSAMLFVVTTAFVDSMITGIIIPLFPGLLMELENTDVSGAAVWGGVATLIYAAMQFIFSPILGGLSDRFGRRPVLLLSLTALAIDMVLLALAWNIWVFLAARTLSGVFAATFSTANAYIADTVPADERAKSYGLIGAAFGVGFIAGPALGGLLGEYDLRAPFYASAGLAALTSVYGFFFVPESLGEDKRRPFSWARSNSFGTLARLFRTSGLGILIPVFFLSCLSGWVYPAVWSYVAIAKFNWSEAEIGTSLTYYGVIFLVSQIVVLRSVLPKLGVARTIWVALAVEAVSLLGIGFAPSTAAIYVLITFALIS
ncbi:MAG: MFS transporter, partial [Myxococcota bacterium]